MPGVSTDRAEVIPPLRDLDIDILYFGPWESKSKHCWGGVWQWAEVRRGCVPDWEDMSLRPEVVAGLEKVKPLVYKYIDGWAEYDDDEGPRGSKKGGDRLRRDLAPFKGLKEVMLDGGENYGDEDEPGQTVFEDYEKSPQQESDAKAEVEVEEAEDWAFNRKLSEHKWTVIQRERAARVLSKCRTKNLTPEEKERGIIEVELVIVKRIPNGPKYANATRNPYLYLD